MTREEWRAGLIRLALLAASVVATIAATAVILHLVGATTSRAIAAGCAIVAIPFLLGGVVVHMRGDEQYVHEYGQPRVARIGIVRPASMPVMSECA